MTTQRTRPGPRIVSHRPSIVPRPSCSAPSRLAVAVAIAGDDPPPTEAGRLRPRRRPADQGPLRRVPHRRHLQGLVLARHPRGDAQVEGRRPRKERRERADRAGHVRRPRVPHAPQGSAAHAPARSPGSRRGSTRGPPGKPGSRSSGRLRRPAEAATSQAARRAATAATIRSTASSTPISPRMESRLPLRSTTRRFARRAFLDVIGLLPPPGELEAFANDAAPDKRARLARRLLDDRRAYADHWLSFWNDLLRNDYAGTGYIDGGRKPITGWLYQSLIDDKPYDRFVRELISPTPESEGFIKGIKWRGRVNASQVREIQFSQNVSQVFFGINMKCASCHDSFIDRWKLADAYGLAAVIAEEPLEIARCDKPTGQIAVPKFPWPELGTIDAAQPREQRLERLAELVTHPDNGRFPRTIANRIWQRLMGRGIVHPVDVMANEPWSEDLLEYLATLPGRPRLRPQGADRAHRRFADLPVEPGGRLGGRCGRRLRLPRPDGQADDGRAVPRRGLVRHRHRPGQGRRVGPPAVRGDRAGAPVRPCGAGQVRRADAVAGPAEPRAGGHDAQRRAHHARGARPVERRRSSTTSSPAARPACSNRCRRRRPTNWPTRSTCGRSGDRHTAGELAAARELVGSPPTPEGLADLLWVVFVLPEFQLIR